jgi:hypothetical protein
MNRLAIVAAALALTAAACTAEVGNSPVPPNNPGSGSATDQATPDANCPAVHFSAMAVTPSIELLVDRSGSMDTTDISPNRYSAITTGLVGASGVVMAEQSRAYFGAALFAADQMPCLTLSGFTAPRALDNATAIKTLLDNHPPNNGNTPTAPAIDAIAADFAANPPPAGSPPIIVLATDGEPNSCGGGADDPGPSLTSAKAAYNAGIRLFILGLAGLNTSYLQDMANAGIGVPANGPNAPYFTANSPTQLSDALNQIIGGVLSCDLGISGQVDPTYASSGTVTLDGQTLVYGTDWTVINGTTIELQGAACQKLKTDTNPVVDAAFPCGAVIL